MTIHLLPRLSTRLLAAACAGLLALAPAAVLAQQPSAPARAQLEAATYPVELAPGGTATLVGGKFEAPAAPGSASKVTVNLVQSATGTIAGQPGAAVVLASSGGGSGTFYELYVTDAATKTIAHVALGDRVQIASVQVDAAGRVLVQGTFKRETDPACCPSLIQRRAYELRGTALVLAEAISPAIDPPAPPKPAATGMGVGASDGLGRGYGVLVLVSVLVASAAARAVSGRGCPRG